MYKEYRKLQSKLYFLEAGIKVEFSPYAMYLKETQTFKAN